MIEKRILKGRSRKDVRANYTLQDELTDNVGADIAKCREYISDSDNVETLIEHTWYIKNTVTESKFSIILSGLPEDIKSELGTCEDFVDYLKTDGAAEVLPISKGPKVLTGLKIPKVPQIFIPVPMMQRKETETIVKVVKEKYDLTGIVLNVLVGFAGLQRRVGTTHQAITTAYFLQKNNFKVALVELKKSRNKCFDDLAQELNVFNTGEQFTYENVDYYKEYDLDKISTLYSKKYNFIIIDFGIYRAPIKNEFTRCIIQVIVASISPWENILFQKFLREVKEEEIGENYSYLLQGVAITEREDYKKLENTGIRLFYSEYQHDIFMGEGYDGLQQLFTTYIDNETNNDEYNNTYNEANNDTNYDTDSGNEKKKLFSLGQATKKSIETMINGKHKTELRGTGVVFLTSLKRGSGCTHIGIAISNYLRRTKSSSVCFINQNENVLMDSLDSSIFQIQKNQDFEELFTGHNYLVFDRGIVGALNKAELIELRRADYKIMLCLADDDYLSRLAEFIREYGIGVKEWIFLFNILPKGKDKEIKKLMNGYKVYCLPLFAASGTPVKSMQNILDDIF